MEIKRLITIGFTRHNEQNEFAADVDLTFRTTPPMALGELHGFCKKFALALGFTSTEVEEYFGEDREDRI